MSRSVSGAAAVAVALLGALLVFLTAPAPTDVHAQARAAAEAAQANPANPVAAARKHISGKAFAVITGAATGAGAKADDSAHVKTGSIDAASLAELSSHGALGVARQDQVTVAVAVPKSGSRLLPASIAALAALLTAGLGLAARRGDGRQPPQREADPPSAVGSVPADGRLAEQRAALVRGLAELAPQLPPALSDEARAVLAGVGVREATADGQRFDPSRHKAVGSMPTRDPGQLHLVARTERPGFVDNGEPVTRPLVVVYADVPGAVT